MANMVEENEALYPLAVTLFGPAAVVAGPESLTKAVEEFGLLLRRGVLQRSGRISPGTRDRAP
jgi:hypothetical protein